MLEHIVGPGNLSEISSSEPLVDNKFSLKSDKIVMHCVKKVTFQPLSIDGADAQRDLTANPKW